MEWNDFDTNKNAFPTTIRIIVDWLSFVSTRWNRIQNKGKFVELSLQPLITGNFRDPEVNNGKIVDPSPALSTLLRNFGFIDDNFNISKLAFLVADNKITYEEYSLIILSKQRGWINNVPVVNCLALLCLYLKTNNYCNVSKEMLIDLSKVNGYDLTPTQSNGDKRNDILFNYINGIGLFEKRDGNLILKENAKEIIDFIADNRDVIGVEGCTEKGERYKYYGDLDSGIFKLKGLKLPDSWKLYYPNLFEISKYDNIVKSGYKGKIIPTIYYGAPGTGKTRFVQEELFEKYDNANRFFTTFHQSYSYEDFVEGLKPILDDNSDNVKYHIEQGVFYNACERAAILAGYNSLKDCIADSAENRIVKFKAAKDNNMTMLLCIDEINRGNVASIFGDLISLIETSKRLGEKYEMTVTLPYSKKEFGVPANLFIVGTMNTADRSIQLLDSALRRRFDFKEMLPDSSVIKNPKARTILDNINARIRSVLNKDNQIGHSYLMYADTDKKIVEALVNKIIPLLEEYFYNDINKVRFVLNEIESEPKDYYFYKKDTDTENAYKEYLKVDDSEDNKSFYKLNEDIVNLSEVECGNYLEHLK